MPFAAPLVNSILRQKNAPEIFREQVLIGSASIPACMSAKRENCAENKKYFDIQS